MAESPLPEESIFAQALDVPAGDRAAFLDRACGGDPSLRAEVEALLWADARTGDLLDLPEQAPTAAVAGPAESAGEAIGPYKLLEPIGEGGFGVVFLAEQTEPVHRKVALKVLKPGMDSKQVVARFEAERQALALMDHPNIAHIFDGGTTPAGRPYFVMELVRGVPITEYCDQKQLPVRDRLGLFVSVCQAVQHAHTKAVIHRDLKPSNVLVTEADGIPVPKVIDFGVAKALGRGLTDKTLFTGVAQMVGTPLYMSPEQAGQNGQDVDTRSDVYSLGVVLYELLTGTTPFDGERLRTAGYDELRRIIREEEPARPSTRLSTLGQAASTVSENRGSDPRRLTRLLRGELDWVVMKCLEKDRNRRYETADALAKDVGRYLADEPVHACPPSAAYRVRKFVRRNKRGLATAALLGVMALASVGAVAGSIGWAARDRAAQRARLHSEVELALREAGEARERALTLVDIPHQWEAALAAALSALRRAEALAGGAGDLLDVELRERVQELAARLEADERDRRLVAKTERIRLDRGETNVKENRFAAREAAPEYRQAFATCGLVAVATTSNEAAALIGGKHPAIQVALIAALDDWLRLEADRPARAWLGAVLAACDGDGWRNQVRAAMWERDRPALEALADRADHQPPATLVNLGDALQELDAHASAICVLRRAQERHPGDFWVNHNLAYVLLRGKPSQPEEAITFYRVALALRPQSAGVHLNLGNALRAKPDLPGAIAAYQKAVELQPDYAEAFYSLGIALRAKGDLPGAVLAFGKTIALRPDHVRARNNLGISLEAQGDLPGALAAFRRAVEVKPDDAEAHNNLGVALRAQGDLPGAIAALRRAVEIRPDYAEAHYHLGNALKDRGDLPGAITAFRRAVEIKPDYAEAHNNLGIALRAQGDLPGAVAAYEKAIAIRPDHFRAHANLGGALHVKGDLPGAVAAYEKAIAIRPDYAEAHNNLGVALRAQGDLPGAIAALRRAVEIRPDYAEAQNNLGNSLKDRGDLPGAITALRRAVEIKPDYAEAHNNLGVALRAQGDLPGAVAAYEKATTIRPDLFRAHTNLGEALQVKGDLPGAVAAYEKAIAIRPNYAEAHHGLGVALKAHGDLRGAVAAYERAIANKPDLAEAHYNLGIALHAQGDLPRTAAAFRRAVAVKPDFAKAHHDLGVVLRAQGDLPGAAAASRKAIENRPDYAEAHCNLGLALQDQGAFRDALAALRRGHELGSKKPGWSTRHRSEEWVKECERLIELDGQLPAILRGETRPADAAERTGLARLCAIRRLNASAARFYEEAFAAKPTLASQGSSRHRYSAARAAALAGSGQGEDAARVPDKDRARWRRQALDWLRADLAAWAKQLERDTPQARSAVLRALQQWQRNPDLAGLRDAEPLAKLHEAERDACRRLWDDVAALLKKAEGTDAR